MRFSTYTGAPEDPKRLSQITDPKAPSSALLREEDFMGVGERTLLKQKLFGLQVTETKSELPWVKQEIYWPEQQNLRKGMDLAEPPGSQEQGHG